MSSVDVIIPCYNYARFLEQCVESVLSQDGVEVRVLIMDDCSPDDTPRVAAGLQRRDGRVGYRRHTENRGHIATYNEGLAWTKGDYVLIISADDLLTPGSLSRSARLLDAHPEVGLVYGRDITFENGCLPPCRVPSDDACGWSFLTYGEFLEQSCALGHTGIQAPTAIARTALHKRIGGYLKELPHTADTEIWLRLAAASAVGLLDAEQAYRRVHRQSMSFLFSSPARLREQKRAFDAHFLLCGEKLPERERLNRAVTDVLVEKALWGAAAAFDEGDVPLCRSFMELALDLDPSARKKPQWSRIRFKQMIGPLAWSCIRGPLGLIRSSRSRCS